MNTLLLTGLQDAATWAWHTSLVMVIPGLCLLVLGRWRGFPVRWRMILAGTLLVRLLVPWVPQVSWHPTTMLEERLVAPRTEAVAVPVQSVRQWAKEDAMERSAEAPPVQSSQGAGMKERAVGEGKAGISWVTMLSMTWALGVLVVGIWMLRSHWHIRRWVRRHATKPDDRLIQLFHGCCRRMGLQRRVGLRAMPGLGTAAVSGWLRPLILVPADLAETHTEDEIRGMLLHELAHVRRWDVLWSWLGLSACALHWFNPLAWLALRRFHTDRELACDRMALAHLSGVQRETYAPALFKTLQTSSAPVSSAALVPFFRRRHEVHTRILAIMKPTQSLAARLAALFLVPALSLLSLTRAGADGEKPPGAGAEGGAEKADGEGAKAGPKDGEGKKAGPRDGENKGAGPRDGEGKKNGPRDGENKGAGPRDGEGKKNGPRDGEGQKPKGPRDGEMRKEGPGDEARAGAAKKGEGEGDMRVRNKKRTDLRREGRGDGAPKAADGGAEGEVTLRITDKGETVKVNGESLPIGRLRGYFNEGNVTGPLLVQADDDVPYKAVMEVLDAAKDNKIWNVTFAGTGRSTGDSGKSGAREREGGNRSRSAEDR